VRLNATHVTAAEVLLSLGPQPLPGALATLSLSDSGDLQEAAANLFRLMHEADALGLARGAAGIAVMPIPDRELGLAINDRLGRAAADRPADHS
jgi:L-threonylcarbamoyladenylate synthase